MPLKNIACIPEPISVTSGCHWNANSTMSHHQLTFDAIELELLLSAASVACAARMPTKTTILFDLEDSRSVSVLGMSALDPLVSSLRPRCRQSSPATVQTCLSIAARLSTIQNVRIAHHSLQAALSAPVLRCARSATQTPAPPVPGPQQEDVVSLRVSGRGSRDLLHEITGAEPVPSTIRSNFWEGSGDSDVCIGGATDFGR